MRLSLPRLCNSPDVYLGADELLTEFAVDSAQATPARPIVLLSSASEDVEVRQHHHDNRCLTERLVNP